MKWPKIKLPHFHKWTEIDLYPPFTNKREYWEGVLRCECGRAKLARIPSKLSKIYVMHPNTYWELKVE